MRTLALIAGIVPTAVLAALTGCGEEAARAGERAPIVSATGGAVATPTTESRDAAIATVVELKGDVRLQRAGAAAWTHLTSGTTLEALDTVQAMAGGEALLRIAATSAELKVTSGTTMRLGASPSSVQALTGHLSAHLVDHDRPRRFELALPPGVLVLTTDPSRPLAEASIDVDPTATTVQVRVGQAELRAASGSAVSIGEKEWVRFHARGTEIDQGGAGPSAELLTPDDGAVMRVRRAVTLRWRPVEGADGYRVMLRTGEVARRIDAPGPSLEATVTTGEYRWSVHAVRGNTLWPPSQPRRLIIEVDDRPPPLTITDPGPGAAVSGPRVRVTGESEPGATIEIGKRQATADAHGLFTLEIDVQPGLTNLVIAARDELGNVRRLSRSVVWD